MPKRSPQHETRQSNRRFPVVFCSAVGSLGAMAECFSDWQAVFVVAICTRRLGNLEDSILGARSMKSESLNSVATILLALAVITLAVANIKLSARVRVLEQQLLSPLTSRISPTATATGRSPAVKR